LFSLSTARARERRVYADALDCLVRLCVRVGLFIQPGVGGIAK
jgi:hypothetical protein